MHDLVVGLVRVLVVDGGLLLGGLLALLVVGRLDRGSGGGGVGVGALGGGDGQGRLARGQGLGLGQRGVARLLVEVDAVADPVPFLRLEVGAGPAGGGDVALVALAGELVGDVDADVVGRGVEAADAAVGAVELGFFCFFFEKKGSKSRLSFFLRSRSKKEERTKKNFFSSSHLLGRGELLGRGLGVGPSGGRGQGRASRAGLGEGGGAGCEVVEEEWRERERESGRGGRSERVSEKERRGWEKKRQLDEISARSRGRFSGS